MNPVSVMKNVTEQNLQEIVPRWKTTQYVSVRTVILILKAHASKVCFNDANCYGLSEIKFNDFTTRIVKYLV